MAAWSKKRILVLFDAINWMMTLPEPYQRRYWQAVRKKLAKASLAQLEAWSDALAAAPSLKQVFK
jgi:hypothetical protein